MHTCSEEAGKSHARQVMNSRNTCFRAQRKITQRGRAENAFYMRFHAHRIFSLRVIGENLGWYKNAQLAGHKKYTARLLQERTVHIVQERTALRTQEIHSSHVTRNAQCTSYKKSTLRLLHSSFKICSTRFTHCKFDKV